MGTMHRMSIHESEQEKMKNWEETTLKPKSREDYPRLGEEEKTGGPQWSIGIRKMDLEEKPSRVTFTQGS